jgi:hypothetical protein
MLVPDPRDWQTMSPDEKQAWLLDKALDCKRDILRYSAINGLVMRSTMTCAEIFVDAVEMRLIPEARPLIFFPADNVVPQLRTIARPADITEKEASRLLRRLERWKDQTPGPGYALSTCIFVLVSSMT